MSQQLDRRTGIGASASPAIMGISPWSSPLGLYLYYTGAIADSDPTEAMLLGIDLEAGIRAAAERKLGQPIAKVPTQRHPKWDFIYASPDGALSQTEGFEAKNVGSRHAAGWGDSGTDEIPDYVNVQVQHQMAVFGFAHVKVAALIWGQDLRIYDIPRADDAIALIVQGCADFWVRVQTRQAPEPDWNMAGTADLMKALYPLKEGRIVVDEESAGELMELIEAFNAAGEYEKNAKRDRDEAKGRMIELTAGATEAVLPDGTIIARSVVNRSGYTVEPTAYESFKIKAAKTKKVKVSA